MFSMVCGRLGVAAPRAQLPSADDAIGAGSPARRGSAYLEATAKDSPSSRFTEITAIETKRRRTCLRETRPAKSRGAVVDAVGNWPPEFDTRDTPLFIAALFGHHEMCEVLCAVGHTPTTQGWDLIAAVYSLSDFPLWVCLTSPATVRVLLLRRGPRLENAQVSFRR